MQVRVAVDGPVTTESKVLEQRRQERLGLTVVDAVGSETGS
jgi:hypothetical protein